jgi:TldD protein
MLILYKQKNMKGKVMYSQEFFDILLKLALKNGGDYADIFLEETNDTVLFFDSGKVKSINTGLIAGAGIRVIICQ